MSWSNSNLRDCDVLSSFVFLAIFIFVLPIISFQSITIFLSEFAGMLICALGYIGVDMAIRSRRSYKVVGGFTGKVTIGQDEYLVSNMPSKDLAELLSVLEDTIRQWPRWHHLASYGFAIYALHDEKNPRDLDEICRDCMQIITDPRDPRGDQNRIIKPPIIDSLQESKLHTIVIELTSTQRILDQISVMMHDLNLSDDSVVNGLRTSLDVLKHEAEQYDDMDHDDQLDELADRIHDLKVSTSFLYDEIDHFHHDITITQESSQSIDQLQQLIRGLRSQERSVME
jgi:hypothetical protein